VEDVNGCGRTDKGVHALEYYISFKSEMYLAAFKVINGLNTYLPKDISIFDCSYPEPEFHARYNAKEKEYIYKIYSSVIRSPFQEGYALQHMFKTDLDKLNSYAEKFIGTHDFRSFMASGSKITDTVRTVYSSHFKQINGMTVYHISANGFLYNMVRIIVGTLLDIDNGKIDGNCLEDIISAGNRKMAGKTAAADGLYLYKVIYR